MCRAPRGLRRIHRLQANGLVDRRASQNDRRYVEISLAKHIAGQAPALGDDGPIGRLEATLRTASPDERQTIKDGLALLVGLADMAGEYR